MSLPTHSVRFVASGRGKAQCPPNPAYPNGIEVNVAPEGVASCTIELPYPAPECGHFVVRCRLCHLAGTVSAAGRPDDPTKITVPCKIGPSEGTA